MVYNRRRLIRTGAVDNLNGVTVTRLLLLLLTCSTSTLTTHRRPHLWWCGYSTAVLPWRPRRPITARRCTVSQSPSPPGQKRRNCSDPIDVFKMAKNLSPVPLSFLNWIQILGHSLKLVKHRCHFNGDQTTFPMEKVINRWMRLTRTRFLRILSTNVSPD